MKLRNEFEIIEEKKSDLIFDIYSEGFAQRASTIILEELNLYFFDNLEDYIN